MAGQSHQSAPGILDRRTLARDHPALASRLAPSLRVLDVGCGTGAITRGIADAVGPGGAVVGIDRDAGLIARAIAAHGALDNLRFEVREVSDLDMPCAFDLVSAARTLQWVADVPAALRRMIGALAPGGRLVLLDYDHADNAWDPAPPSEFAAFYRCFLAWREANGWDNRMASHLPAILAAVGVRDTTSEVADEITTRGDADFEERSRLWAEVVDGLGPALVQAKACDPALVRDARQAFEDWRRSTLQRQTLALRVVTAQP
jgi:SAM-dependent methyltransferase